MPLSERAKKLGQEPAFPYAIEHGTEAWNGGMTKREHFAVEAMKGLQFQNQMGSWDREGLAMLSIQQADALLEALAKEEG